MKGLVLFFSLFFPDLHPFHSSVTEMTYNQKDQSWEISIRLFQDDLEQTVSSSTGKKFRMILVNGVIKMGPIKSNKVSLQKREMRAQSKQMSRRSTGDRSGSKGKKVNFHIYYELA